MRGDFGIRTAAGRADLMEGDRLVAAARTREADFLWTIDEGMGHEEHMIIINGVGIYRQR